MMDSRTTLMTATAPPSPHPGVGGERLLEAQRRHKGEGFLIYFFKPASVWLCFLFRLLDFRLLIFFFFC